MYLPDDKNDAGSNSFEPLLPLREAAELLGMHWKT